MFFRFVLGRDICAAAASAVASIWTAIVCVLYQINVYVTSSVLYRAAATAAQTYVFCVYLILHSHYHKICSLSISLARARAN